MERHDFKVAVLDMYDGYPNEGMRCIKMLLDEFFAKGKKEGSYVIYDVRGKAEVPAIEKYDAFISTGGPGSPLVEGVEWEKRFFLFMEQLISFNQKNEEKKHLFLICHSFQLAVQYFELATVNQRKSTSFGVMPVHKKLNHYLFKPLENPFWAVDSRDFQVVMPDKSRFLEIGAKILAIEKDRPQVPLERAIMAIEFSPEIIGVQFHPEADALGMRKYFLRDDKKEVVIRNHGEEKYYDMLEHLDDPDKIMLTESVIIPRFLERAYFQFHPVEENV